MKTRPKNATVDVIASQANTPSQAQQRAVAVNEARVLAALVLGTKSKVDEKLFALELAYWRRADQLTKARAVKRRRRR